MSNLGPHEQQLRALREEKARRRASVPRRSTTTPPAAPAHTEEKPMFDTDNASAMPEAQPPKKRRERKAAKKAKPAKKAAKKDTRIKAGKKPKKPAAKRAQAPKPQTEKAGPREGSKLALIQGLLARPGGCTRADILAATEWPSCSVPQQAAALGVELKTSKEKGEPTRYWVD